MWQIPIPGNPPTVREIRSKDHVASWKTWIARIVKNSSTAEILPELSCVVLDLSLPQQSFKSVSALLVSHCICLELGCLRALRIKWCEKIWERKCGSAETLQRVSWVCVKLFEAGYFWICTSQDIWGYEVWAGSAYSHCLVPKFHETLSSDSELSCSLELWVRICP